MTPGSGWARWRPGFVLPRKWRTNLSGEHLPYQVELDFEVVDGQPSCVSFRLIGPSLAPGLIGAVPVGACMNTAIAGAVRRINDDGSIVVAPGPANMSDILKKMRGRDGIDYSQVAAAYQAGGNAPTQAVADNMQVSYSTAQRYVAECRKRGLLAAVRPKAEPKAPEAAEPAIVARFRSTPFLPPSVTPGDRPGAIPGAQGL